MNISLFVRELGKLRYGLVFTMRRDVKKDKNEETMNPLDSLRRPGSAEQVQFLTFFRSNGGKREASARASHAREEK